MVDKKEMIYIMFCMSREKIIERCVIKLKMTQQDAEWVADNLDWFYEPNWSEWSWRQIDKMFRETLTYKS